MSEYTTETIFVTDADHPDGYLINKEDFNEAIHTKAVEEKPKSKKS